MQLSEIRLDENLRELTVRGEPDYPIAMYDNDMAGFLTGSVPWHWHREIEFIYVYQGDMKVEAGEKAVLLHPGQGAFFNSGVLHCMYRENMLTCKMVTVAFDPLLISGAETSLFHNRYVLPLMKCQALPVLWLTGDFLWHKDVLEKLKAAYDAFLSEDFGKEMAVRQLLSEIWLILMKENEALLHKKEEGAKDGRLKQMLQYIRTHLADEVRLEDIAASAGVSTRECTRCFRDMLGITPIFHLTQMRMRSAAMLLEDTEEPVTEICFAVGFENPSYFSTVFKECTGLTPREYRKKKKNKAETGN